MFFWRALPVNASFNASATTVCTGVAVTFTNTSTGATIYDWRQNNVNFASTTNTTRTFGSAGSYVISLIAGNGTCTDTATVTITVNAAPATPGTMSGNATVCAGSANTYSVTAVPGATSYTWTLPGGWSGSSTTNSIATTAGASGGTISVTASNTCGTSSPQSLTVTVESAPATPGTISGNATVCAGSANTYSVTAVPGATSYTWTLPGGWSGSSTTNSIATTAGTSGGTISVTASNTCGTSSPQSLTVTVESAPATPGTISGNATVCAGSAIPFRSPRFPERQVTPGPCPADGVEVPRRIRSHDRWRKRRHDFGDREQYLRHVLAAKPDCHRRIRPRHAGYDVGQCHRLRRFRQYLFGHRRSRRDFLHVDLAWRMEWKFHDSSRHDRWRKRGHDFRHGEQHLRHVCCTNASSDRRSFSDCRFRVHDDGTSGDIQ
ncbi:MAG: hypothetical protein IPP17_06990 [Bacteroidetes bacterium]|nr:hypothetical protein [Bacteroidota bacterium]